jgi:hypothetical protein
LSNAAEVREFRGHHTAAVGNVMVARSTLVGRITCERRHRFSPLEQVGIVHFA